MARQTAVRTTIRRFSAHLATWTIESEKTVYHDSKRHAVGYIGAVANHHRADGRPVTSSVGFMCARVEDAPTHAVEEVIRIVR